MNTDLCIYTHAFHLLNVKHITEDFRILGPEKSEWSWFSSKARTYRQLSRVHMVQMAPSRNHLPMQAVGLPIIFSNIMKYRRPCTILCTSDTKMMVMFRRRRRKHRHLICCLICQPRTLWVLTESDRTCWELKSANGSIFKFKTGQNVARLLLGMLPSEFMPSRFIQLLFFFSFFHSSSKTENAWFAGIWPLC